MKRPASHPLSKSNQAKALSRWQLRSALRKSLGLCLRCGVPVHPKTDRGHFVCADCRRIMAIKNRVARAVSHKLDETF